ncbi:hypothetical protein [Blastopirellula marina]|uniref:hypothetical protein n=1 Tax=Blastopirellula marina TaxID=124 RepID=UPI001304C45F|nr:hypothetical protein [Blastopirellula marina]
MEFRIAEALQRPPLEWSELRDHTFAEISQPLPLEDNADEMISRWEQLWANNPAHPESSPQWLEATSMVVSAIDLEEMGAKLQAYVQQNFAFLTHPSKEFSMRIHPAELISLDDLPQLHTGEGITLETEAEYAQFPLDPYGYDEYNGYFEPEIYDWFVFVTDDLTVVYVHENSDIMPNRLAQEDLGPEAPPAEVPESFKVAIRESVRAVFSGEVNILDLVDDTRTTLSGATKPIWTRYVTQNELLGTERVAQLRELLRF